MARFFKDIVDEAAERTGRESALAEAEQKTGQMIRKFFNTLN